MSDRMKPKKARKWGYVVIWEFHVRPGMRKRFEEAYGPAGEWVMFFSQTENYIRTELIQNLKESGAYLTLDFWTSRRAYDQFRKKHAKEYESIDTRCEGMTQSEREIGRFLKARASRER